MSENITKTSEYSFIERTKHADYNVEGRTPMYIDEETLRNTVKELNKFLSNNQLLFKARMKNYLLSELVEIFNH